MKKQLDLRLFAPSCQRLAGNHKTRGACLGFGAAVFASIVAVVAIAGQEFSMMPGGC